MSVLAFALGGIALVGVPPSGAYVAKELFLRAAAESEQWWWAIVIQSGGILTSGYLLLVLGHMLLPADAPIRLRVQIPRRQEAATLALALASLLLGLVHWETYLPVPRGTLPSPLTLKTFSTTFWPFLGGAVLAILLGRWGHRPNGGPGGFVAVLAPARRIALALAGGFERIDTTLRQWPAAGLSVLVVAILFGFAMLAGR
jgi:multicomponent Na+:H+ antiporter subunit D